MIILHIPRLTVLLCPDPCLHMAAVLLLRSQEPSQLSLTQGLRSSAQNSKLTTLHFHFILHSSMLLIPLHHCIDYSRYAKPESRIKISKEWSWIASVYSLSTKANITHYTPQSWWSLNVDES